MYTHCIAPTLYPYTSAIPLFPLPLIYTPAPLPARYPYHYPNLTPEVTLTSLIPVTLSA